jgi:phage terminase large subunit GpA-like protein
MEQYYVPCPECEKRFVILWDNIQFDKNNKTEDDVYLECPHCVAHIDEGRHKTWMLDNGKWMSVKDSPDGEPYEVGDVEYPSFQISSLYSPLGFFSWKDAVHDWKEYLQKKDIYLLQVFINQVLGETFSLEGQDISYSSLYDRREEYAADVPAGALVLTCGVDIQDDRIEAEVVGWGLNNESWSIDYKVFPGKTGLMGDRRGMLANGQPSVWRLLDDFLQSRWTHESGAPLGIEITMVDCGYKGDEAHKFCRPREHERVYPVRGYSGWGKGLFKNNKNRHQKYGTKTTDAYVDELKNKLYAGLAVAEVGPAYCHFPRRPEYDEQHFKGLTCENKATKIVGGKQILYWDNPSGARNEPIDCRNYAQVAFLSYPVNLEHRADKGLHGLFTDNSAPRPKPKKRRRGSRGIS